MTPAKPKSAAPPKQAGIQSVELGFKLIFALMDAGSALSLTELARLAGMSTSKARGYLISFVRLGLIQQKGDGGHYDLGATSVRLGLSAMNRVCALEIARAHLESLQLALHETTCLCVWGDFGPVVVDKLDGARSSPFELRLGMTVPLIGTATGRTFMAYMPRERYAEILARELAEYKRMGAAKPDVEKILKEVRSNGCASVRESKLPGFGSVAVPLLDHRGSLIASINVIGPSNQLDVSAQGQPATELRKFALHVSRQCGAA